MADGQMNRQWRLARRPQGAFADDDVTLAEEPVPEPADGQAPVRVSHVTDRSGHRRRVPATARS